MSADANPTRTRIQFLKFLVVGALNAAFGYSVFALLVLAGVPPRPALVATYVVGILFNFVTTRKLVFQHKSRAAFGRFVGAYVVIYLFNMALYEAIAATGAVPLVSQAICVPVVAVFSFYLFKFHVFKDGHSA